MWAAIHGWVSLEPCGIGIVEDQDAGAELICNSVMNGLRPARSS